MLDEQNRPVPDGEPGELVTQGPHTIRGYFNAPELNAQAFTPEGFYRMGDVPESAGGTSTRRAAGRFDHRGGEKISCDEIENLIFGLRRSSR